MSQITLSPSTCIALLQRLWSQLTLVRKVCSFGNILITDVRTEQFWPLLAILANIRHALEHGALSPAPEAPLPCTSWIYPWSKIGGGQLDQAMYPELNHIWYTCKCSHSACINSILECDTRKVQVVGDTKRRTKQSVKNSPSVKIPAEMGILVRGAYTCTHASTQNQSRAGINKIPWD